MDRPEVFTRERLINRRLVELQWLDRQLERDITSTLQGARERRTFSGFASGLDVQFDPMGGAGAAESLETLRSAELTRRLQNEVYSAALEQRLKDLQLSNITHRDILGTNPLSIAQGSNATFSPPSAPINNVFNFNTSNIPAAPSASNIALASDRIQLTSVEQFQDRLAYRDAVQAQMRERELDDSHDQIGMTLYTLKFDLSVLPGNHNPNFGRINVKVTNGSAPVSYRNWVESVRRYIDTEVISLQRRYLLDYLSDEEKRKLAVMRLKMEDALAGQLADARGTLAPAVDALTSKAAKAGAAASLEAWKQAAEVIRNGSAKDLDLLLQAPNLDQSVTNVIAAVRDSRALGMALNRTLQSGFSSQRLSEKETEWVLAGICRLVTDQFTNVLTTAIVNERRVMPLVFIGAPIRVGSTNEGFLFLAPVQTNAAAERLFGRVVKKLEIDAQPFVYTVEPKQYAQNLSDAAARESVRSFALQLAAALPQAGVKAGGYANYVQRTQYFLEAIKRLPLITGFLGPDSQFGWIIGPRFKVKKNAELDFEHVPAQHSVQATVAVPAWWTHVRVEVTNSWLTADAEIGEPAGGHTNEFIRLSPRLDALTEALRQRFDWSFTSPQVYPRWDTTPDRARYIVQPRRPAELLIRGRNLWRNPQVFVGSQGTRDIEVLPDMEGIVARFSEIHPVVDSSGTDDPFVDLRVVTSAGQALLRNAVRIVSGTRQAGPQAMVSLPYHWAVAGAKLETEVKTEAVPESHAGFIALLAAPGQPLTMIDTVQSPNDDKLVFTMPAVNGPWASPTTALADVQLKLNPTRTPISVLQGGPQQIVVFTNPNQSTLRVTPATIEIITNSSPDAVIELQIQPPPTSVISGEFFRQAWPAFHQLTDHRIVPLMLKKGDRELVLQAGPFAAGKATAKLLHAEATKRLSPSAEEEFEAILMLSPDNKAVQVPAEKVKIKGKSK